MMENNRKTFANELAIMGDSGDNKHGECHSFGITWGCKPDCPVFERGECEFQKENEKRFYKEEETKPNKDEKNI